MATRTKPTGHMPKAFTFSPAGTPPLVDRAVPRPSEVRGGPYAHEGAVLRWEAIKTAKLKEH